MWQICFGLTQKLRNPWKEIKDFGTLKFILKRLQAEVKTSLRNFLKSPKVKRWEDHLILAALICDKVISKVHCSTCRDMSPLNLSKYEYDAIYCMKNKFSRRISLSILKRGITCCSFDFMSRKDSLFSLIIVGIFIQRERRVLRVLKFRVRIWPSDSSNVWTESKGPKNLSFSLTFPGNDFPYQILVRSLS